MGDTSGASRIYQPISHSDSASRGPDMGAITADLKTHLGASRQNVAAFSYGIAQQNRHFDSRFREGEMGAIVQVNPNPNPNPNSNSNPNPN